MLTNASSFVATCTALWSRLRSTEYLHDQIPRTPFGSEAILQNSERIKFGMKKIKLCIGRKGVTRAQRALWPIILRGYGQNYRGSRCSRLRITPRYQPNPMEGVHGAPYHLSEYPKIHQIIKSSARRGWAVLVAFPSFLPLEISVRLFFFGLFIPCDRLYCPPFSSSSVAGLLS